MGGLIEGKGGGYGSIIGAALVLVLAPVILLAGLVVLACVKLHKENKKKHKKTY